MGEKQAYQNGMSSQGHLGAVVDAAAAALVATGNEVFNLVGVCAHLMGIHADLIGVHTDLIGAGTDLMGVHSMY